MENNPGVKQTPLLASVVVPTYNRREMLSRCLRSLIGQTADPAAYELVVVDDGSTDGTPEVMREFILKSPCAVNYLRQENAGRSRARNNGVLAARGRYVIFVDSDVVVKTGFIAAHLAAHAEPGRVVQGRKIITSNYDDPTSEPVKVTDYSRAFFDTANVSVEREKLIEAGLFDEDFVEYGWEDLELGLRLRRLGLKGYRSAEACGYHLEPPLDYREIPNLLKKEGERGHTALQYYRKHPSFEVRMTTANTPLLFEFDRLVSFFHWPERPGTKRLLERLSKSGRKFRFQLLVAVLRNHAYAEGLREAKAWDKKKR